MKKVMLVLLAFGIFALFMVITFRGKSIPSINSKKIEISTDTTIPQEMQIQRYDDYSLSRFEDAKGAKRVYFFHAKWCPTCKAAHTQFSENTQQIPQGVVLFKTDYDTETELKKKYGITYQHTFVQVDDQGNEITKWNGGGIEELVANIK